MPFQVNLGFFNDHEFKRHPIDISIVITKNAINFNFQAFSPHLTPDYIFDIAIREFGPLLSSSYKDITWDEVRGEDSEHVKMHHIHKGGVEKVHSHIYFKKNITPELLADIVEDMIKAHENKSFKYKCLDPIWMNNIVTKFRMYYDDKNTKAVEMQFARETTLSESDCKSLRNYIAKNGGRCSERQKKMLRLDSEHLLDGPSNPGVKGFTLIYDSSKSFNIDKGTFDAKVAKDTQPYQVYPRRSAKP